jgi:glycosyltransferase involved in cell wall biosynthesis
VTLSCPGTPEEHAACLAGLNPLLAGYMPVSVEVGRRERRPALPGRLKRLGKMVGDLVSNPSPYVFRYASEAYRSLIQQHRHDFDAVFCRYMYMWPVIEDFPHQKIVVDVDDLHYLGLIRSARNGSFGWGAPLLMVEALRSYVYEQSRYRRIARALVCSQADLARIQGTRKTIVPNGIDLPDPARLKSTPSPNTIIFVGQMSFEPNVQGLRWFLDKVWPQLTQLVPDVRLLVVGRQADAATLPFAGRPGVELVGEVEETASWFSTAVLSVAPLRYGLGTRIKIIESLACGRPVVATSIGAEGLDDLDERCGLFRADAPRAMAGCIASLLENPARAHTLGAEGRAVVESRYTWDKTTSELASHIEQWISAECPEAIPPPVPVS